VIAFPPPRWARAGQERSPDLTVSSPAPAARSGYILHSEGISTRVVSMPGVEWFTTPDASYQEVAAAAESPLARSGATARSEES
jgi:transketolase